MCIAILNTANLIDKNTLKTCWNNNNDGAGLLYPERNKVHVFKELKSLLHSYCIRIFDQGENYLESNKNKTSIDTNTE